MDQGFEVFAVAEEGADHVRGEIRAKPDLAVRDHLVHPLWHVDFSRHNDEILINM